LFYEIITTVSLLCIGSDMVEASHIKYD
jgi:hypothetical protein